MNRAYSILDVKSIDQDRRVFRGVATTPSADRVNDRLDPLGATFAAEIPLLHAHRHDVPIGVVRLGKATAGGIPFEAEIPVIHEPPSLKERVDVAWGELVHGLVRAVSIGFRPLSGPTLNDIGGLDFGDTEIMELSTVAIPAQSEAIISQIKSLDAQARKAAGISDTTDHQPPIETAASGKSSHVVRLSSPARDRAAFTVRRIVRT